MRKVTIAISINKELEQELREEAKALNVSLSAYASMIFAKRVK